MFGAGKLYVLVPASLGIGLLLPVPFYLAWRFLPAQFKKTRTALKTLNTAIITQYSCYMSVGINSSVMPSMVIGVFSQWFVRKRYPRAFTKYNYLLAGALDGGTQVISFILNFAVVSRPRIQTAHLDPISPFLLWLSSSELPVTPSRSPNGGVTISPCPPIGVCCPKEHSDVMDGYTEKKEKYTASRLSDFGLALICIPTVEEV